MKLLLALSLVFSLLTVNFAAVAASPDMASGFGCATVASGELCIDPNMLPANSGSGEKSSKCLGPYLVSNAAVVCRAGTVAHAHTVTSLADGVSPGNPKRPPRI